MYAALGVKSRDKGGRLHDYTETGEYGWRALVGDWWTQRELVAPIGGTKVLPIVRTPKVQRARPHGSVEGDFSRAFLLNRVL